MGGLGEGWKRGVRGGVRERGEREGCGRAGRGVEEGCDNVPITTVPWSIMLFSLSKCMALMILGKLSQPLMSSVYSSGSEKGVLL